MLKQTVPSELSVQVSHLNRHDNNNKCYCQFLTIISETGFYLVKKCLCLADSDPFSFIFQLITFPSTKLLRERKVHFVVFAGNYVYISWYSFGTYFKAVSDSRVITLIYESEKDYQ